MQETWETQVRSLSREDPLEEDMATHSSNLAWKVPWSEEPGGLQSRGSQSEPMENTRVTRCSCDYTGFKMINFKTVSLVVVQNTKL